MMKMLVSPGVRKLQIPDEAGEIGFRTATFGKATRVHPTGSSMITRAILAVGDPTHPA
jgi:hypothetical protein